MYEILPTDYLCLERQQESFISVIVKIYHHHNVPDHLYFFYRVQANLVGQHAVDIGYNKLFDFIYQWYLFIVENSLVFYLVEMKHLALVFCMKLPFRLMQLKKIRHFHCLVFISGLTCSLIYLVSGISSYFRVNQVAAVRARAQGTVRCFMYPFVQIFCDWITTGVHYVYTSTSIKVTKKCLYGMERYMRLG